MNQSDKLAHLTAIATALDGEVVRQAEDQGSGSWAVAWINVDVRANENFPACCVSLNYHEDRKGDYVHVSGEWPAGPADAHGNRGPIVTGRDAEYGTANPSINVSAGKTPQRIADEIRRRFMPEFSRLYVKAAAIVEARAQFARDVAANVRTLAAACDATIGNNGNGVPMLRGLPDGVRVAHVSNSSVRLEVECSIAEACVILAARQLAGPQE